MSNQFLKLRRSSVPGKVPTTSSLEFGEIALNTYDGLAFIKKSGSNGEEIITIGSTSGSFTGSLFGTSSWAEQALTSSYSLNINGETYYVAVYTGNNTLGTGSFYDSGSFTAIGSTTPTDPANPERLFVDAGNTTSYNLISGHGEIDNYLQLNVQNFSYGATASSDIVATSNDGTQNDNYIDMGINNSGYNIQDGIGGPHDAYLYSTGNDLLIGNASDGKKIIIFNGSGGALANARIIVFDQGTVGINANAVNNANPEALLVEPLPGSTNDFNNLIVGRAEVQENYVQLNIQNTGTGSLASSDIVATNDIGTETDYYIDMGINSSGYNTPNQVGGPNDAYLYSTGEHLHIGNASAGQPLMFFAGGLDADANQKLYIGANNQHEMTGSLNMSGSLIVTDGITGSLHGTASWALNTFTASFVQQAVSASYALTASYATSVSGTIQNAVSSAYAETSSWSINALTASYVDLSQTASFVTASNVFGPYGANSIESASFAFTASYALNAGASDPFPYTGSAVISGSLRVTGSISSTEGFTGSLFGTASWAQNSVTASYVLQAVSSSFSSTASFVALAQTASYVQTAQTASYVQTAQTASFVATASWSNNATTASFVTTAQTASYVQTAQTASYVQQAQSASYVLQAVSSSFASTASFVALAQTASFVSTASWSNNAVTASFVTTAQTASYVLQAVSASYAATSSWAINALTASSADNFTVRQDITASNALFTGTITAQRLNVQYVTASTEFITGSTKFGTQLTDTHQFTGSVSITGSLSVDGALNATSSWAVNASTASFVATSSWANNAVTASYVLNAVSSSFASTASFVTLAQTASYVQQAQTASYVLQAVSSSFASTASFVTASNVWGPFGSNSIVSSSYALTASYALNAGGGGAAFPYTGSAIISGSLQVTGSVSITGSLSVEGALNATSSWAQNAISSSYPIAVTGSTLYSVDPTSGPDFSYNNSIFLGGLAGAKATYAQYSNFIGNGAGYSASDANNSNFIGYFSGESAEFAYDSNFIGSGPGYLATYADHSNFLGTYAGDTAVNANNSNFLGDSAGAYATNAQKSNFLGKQSGYLATDAYYSNFLGFNAGYSASSANNSNFLGFNAGNSATNANDSNFLGQYAGINATNANDSNFLGYYAGSDAINANNSTFIGRDAGNTATDASHSFFVGQESGLGSQNATNSNFIGQYAGANSSNADNSNFFGNEAGLQTNAKKSNFIGQQAGTYASFATQSNFLGSQAGYNASNANDSNFFGYQAGRIATSARNSTFIGNSAGYAAIQANDSNFIGRAAGYSASNASNSNFLGPIAGYQSNNAGESNFIGYQAGAYAPQAYVSNFIGSNAGYSSKFANFSNFIGYKAGDSAASASYSVLLGFLAGYNFSGTGIGRNNIIIGTKISLPVNYANGINIGGLIFGSGSYFDGNDTGSPFSGSANGKIGINQPFPSYSLDVNGNGRFSNGLDVTGSLSVSGVVTAQSVTSSLFGTSSWAEYSSTASYVLQAVSASFSSTAQNAVSSSYPIAVTGSTLYSANPIAGEGSKTHSIFFGSASGYLANSANNSNFFGQEAGYKSTYADNSNFFGQLAGAEANAYQSNFLGWYAGAYATNVYDSNFLGYNAGYAAENANNSNFFGYSSGWFAKGAKFSNFSGYGAGLGATSASYSNLFGYQVGFTNLSVNTIGSNNIIIGTNITLPIAYQNGINLGGLIFGSGSYSTTTGNPFSGSTNGRIGINQPDPQFSLDVSGSGRYTNGLQVTGSLNAPNITGSLFGTSSWALNVSTASYVLQAVSASFASTASFVQLAQSASYVLQAVSSSFATTASYSVSSSYAVTSTSASYALTSSYGINIVVSGSVNNVDYIQFNTTASVTDAVGRLYYGSGEGVLQYTLANGNVVARIGEDLYQYAYNASGAPMTKGQLVYISGSQGNRIAVKLASNQAEQGSSNVLGFVAESIGAGAEGWVQTNGVLRKVNTVGLTAGQLIFLSSTPGAYTQTFPQAPSHSVRLGFPERIDATVGSIYIKIDNGYETDELHDVAITSASSGDLLVRTGSIWVNSKQLTGSYGLTGSLTATGGGFTGSLYGTASWAENAITASYVTLAQTASYVTLAQSASYVQQAQSASYVLNAVSSSYAATASSADAFTVRNFLELAPGTDPGTANVSSSYFFVTASSDNTEQNLHFRNNGALWEMHWLEQVTNTGLVWGGILTFTASLTDTPPNRTQMRITPGAGLIINHNANTGSHGDTTPTYVQFGPITASADFITSSQVTYLLIDENGQLVQQTTKFTPQQYVEKFPLGYIFCLTTSSISSYADARVTTYGQAEQEGEFVRAFGPLKLSGYDITAQSSSLKISIAAGQSYRYGGFYTQNPQSPSIYDSTAVATGSLVRVYRDPSVTGGFRAQTNAGLPFTDIDPTKYDDGSGTLQTVSASQWSIQRVFQGVVNNVSYVYYGQNVYDSLALALQSITTDQFVESPTSILALPFIGYIIARGNTSDLSDTANNRIIQAGLFRNTAGSSGGGGAAAQNLNDLGDVTISGATNGQALVYNSGLWVNGDPANATNAVTASYVLQAVSASFSTTASYVQLAETASYVTLAQTASYVTTAQTASYVQQAQSASYVLQAVSSSYSLSSSYAISASRAQTAGNAATVDVFVFGSDVESYVLMSNVAGTTGVSVGGDADLRYNSSTNKLTVGSISATSLTGSLLGTSSWAQNAVTASFVTTAQTASYVLQAVSSSFSTNAATASFVTLAQTASFVATASWALNATTASFITTAQTASFIATASWSNNAVTASFVTTAQTASYVLQSVSASFASTASYVNSLNQNVIVTGSVYISASGANSSLVIGGNATSSAENVLVVGVPAGGPGSGEGGQISLQAPNSGGYTSASMIDNYQNLTRLLRGTNAGSDAVVASFNMHTKQFSLPAYNGASAFVGTAAANLAVDSSGNVITVSTSGGTVFPYTGTAVITGSLVVTDAAGNTGAITASGPIRSLANGTAYFRGGDDAEFWDINVANTVGIYGLQDQTLGSLKLGSGGGTISGKSGNIGIGTIDPGATLHVQGNVSASSFTGSLFGTSSWSQNSVTASFVTTAQTASFVATASWANNAVTASFVTTAQTASFVTLAQTASFVATSSWAQNAVTSSYPLSVTGSSIYSVGPQLAGPNIPQVGSIVLGSAAGFNANAANNFSTYIGFQAGYNASGSNASNFIGYVAGWSTTGSYWSNMIGLEAGYDSKESNSSNFIGYEAGYQAVSASDSNFIGSLAGYQTKTARNSNMIGYLAGYQADNASNSNFIGNDAGDGAKNASGSNFIGYNAGFNGIVADKSNFIGWNAGNTAASASYSNLIGFQAGYNDTFNPNRGIGRNNIIIGTNITLSSSYSNGINLGGLIFGSGAYGTITGTPLSGSVNGRVGINQPLPLFSLDVSGSGRYTSDLTVTGSLISTGGFTGSLVGTSSWANNAVTASFVTTAQTASFVTTAQTASYVLQAVSASYATAASYSLATKAGAVANTSFTGNPRKATVTFGSAFPNTNYAVTITGEDSRTWTIESKLAGSFVINANANTALNGTTYWIAAQYNG